MVVIISLHLNEQAHWRGCWNLLIKLKRVALKRFSRLILCSCASLLTWLLKCSHQKLYNMISEVYCCIYPLNLFWFSAVKDIVILPFKAIVIVPNCTSTLNTNIELTFAIFLLGLDWKCWAGRLKQGTGKHLSLLIYFWIYTFFAFFFFQHLFVLLSAIFSHASVV